MAIKKVIIKYNGTTISEATSAATKTLVTNGKLLNGNIEVQIEEGRLPTGYTEVEYVQFDGTQYIKTGVQSTSIDNLRYKFNASFVNGDIHIVCNTRSASSKCYRIYCAILYNQFYCSYNTVEYYDAPFGTCNANTIYDVDAYIGDNSQYIKIDGVTLKSTSYAMHSSSTENIIGGWNGNGEMTPQYKGKLYEIKTYKNSNLVFDYVPCKTSSGEVGFYDLVSKTFKGKAVGNDLIAGPEV